MESNVSKKYQIRGIVGAGYRESANFNPSSGQWETRGMDSARYDIDTREQAEALIENARADQDVSEVEIEEIEHEMETE